MQRILPQIEYLAMCTGFPGSDHTSRSNTRQLTAFVPDCYCVSKRPRHRARETVKAFYWTLGRYDMVSILEAPDVETITALGLSVGKLGNVRTETLPAFDGAGMEAILKKAL